MSSIGSFFLELRKRRLFQIAVVYLGVGWVLVEMAGFVADNYALSRKLIDVTVLLVILGFPAVLITGWFHGEQGHQRATRAELWLLSTLGVMAAIGTYRITTAEETASPAGGFGDEVVAPTGDGAVRLADVEDLGERSIAVFPFQNSVGAEGLAWLGPGLADMLTTNFAQVPELRVVGRQRLFDLLRESGHSETDEIPEGLAQDLAVRSGARLMVRGSVLGTEDDLAIDAQLIELGTGTVVAAERARGEDVFAMVDTLSTRLVSAMMEATPLELAERGAPLAGQGTRNLEAYRAFHEGLAAEREARDDEARVRFERAVELDSTFALPLLRLSDLEGRESEQGAVYLRRGLAQLQATAIQQLGRLPPEARVEIQAVLGDSIDVSTWIDSVMGAALGRVRAPGVIPPDARGGRRPPPRRPRDPPPDGRGDH